MLSEVLVILGIASNAIGTAIYFVATLKGEVKPNKVTFLLWALPPFVTFFAQINQGVGIQSLMTLSVGILPLIVLGASFVNKKAYWKTKAFDLSCGSLSIVGLVLWYLTKEGNLAIIFSILADGLASLPTIIKAYHHPETESAIPWLGSVIGGALTVLSVAEWNFQTVAFPLYYTIAMFFIFFFTATKIGKRK
jgi:hypothetical protein